VAATPAPGQGRQPTSLAQRWLPIAAVIWGFVGTALFFSRKPSAGKPGSRDHHSRGNP
jgi:hypothetical protein